LRGNSIPHKARRRRLPQLSIKEVQAVHDAIYVDKLTHASAAIKCGVCNGTVRKIVRSFKVKDDYVQELLDARLSRQAKVTMAVSAIRDCIENEQDIWSLNQVRSAVVARHDFVLPKRLLS
jgi:transposase